MTDIKVPNTWDQATLECLVLFCLGGDWGKAVDHLDPDYVEVRCIRASEVKEWDLEKGRSAVRRKIKASSLKKRRLEVGDILVEISGGGPEQPVGRTLVIDQRSVNLNENAPKVCTNFFRMLKISKNVDSRYVNHYLKFFYSSGEINEYQSGSNNLRNLKFNDYLAIHVPLPPLNEQKRIVAKLEELFSELDKGVDSLKTAREQLKVYRQAVLNHAFEGKLTAGWRKANPDKLESPEQLLVRFQHPKMTSPSEKELALLPEIPNSWVYYRLGCFIESINAGKSFKCEEREPTQTETGVAKVSAVTWGEYDETETKTCLDESKINPDYFIKRGDFLFSRANTIGLVGACVIVKETTKTIMLSDKTLRLNIKNTPPLYLLYYLRCESGRKEIMSRSTGNQDSMRNIGQDRIKNIVVPLCSSGEIDEIISRIQNSFGKLEVFERDIERELGKALALRQSILKKAFSGQLVPQDPSDEPASVLLERIKEEKAKQAPAPKRRSKRKALA